MAHELTFNKQTGQHEMAFVGVTPWHGFGQSLTFGASIEEWATAANLNWRALASVPMFTRADGTIGRFGEKQVIYRSDNGQPLSVMGEGYQIVQPIEVLEFFRDLIADGGWQLHTAGTLRGGRKIWAMASRADMHGYVVPGDRVAGNLLLTTSLDGSTPTIAALTSVRVVCANTLGAALRGKTRGAKSVKGSHVRVGHRTQFDADAVKAQIGVAVDAYAQMMDDMRKLAAMPCALDEAREILRGIFGQPHKSKADATASDGAVLDLRANMVAEQGAAEVGSSLLASLLAQDNKTGELREQKSVARSLALFAGEGMGADHAGVAGTRWGLLNAITQHVDHEQGRAADTRLESAWYGRGDDFKQSALAALLTA